MKLELINKLTIDAYEHLALKYHQSFKDEMNEKAYDRGILDKFDNNLKPKSEICDAGCGPSGHIGKYLHEKGHNVTGIDISPKCISIASNYENEMTFHCMDMMHTSFEAKTFDGVISFYSIIHTPKNEVSKILLEYNRILKPGGQLLIVVKKGKSEGILKDEWYEGHEIYFTNFLETDLIELLSANNFDIEFQETRRPYDSEIAVERIYIIARKSEA